MLKLVFNFLKKINFFVSKNKKRLFSLIVLLSLLFVPIRTVRAGIFENIFDSIQSGISYVLNIPINIILLLGMSFFIYNFYQSAFISALVYIIIVFIARWMITFSLGIGISPTNINTPEAIRTGWNFTLGFVNMFFALTLTFIGLATILRIKEYEAKKLLSKILRIAVLINFTPVIIGFIVDMGNIVTNFFVIKTTWQDMGSFITHLIDLFNVNDLLEFLMIKLTNLGSNFVETFVTGVGLITGIFISTIYVWFASYVYFCISGVFFLRVIMLWTLTILSPIAFFSYIFEDTTLKMLFPGILSWKEWWEEFLKWVIVGIPFGLFLYISQAMVSTDLYEGINLLEGTGVGPTFEAISLGEGIIISFEDLLNPIVKLLAQLTSIMMLYQGYKIGTAAAPAMAKSMITGTEKLVKMAAMAAATAGVGAAAGAAAGSMGSAASGLTKFAGSAAKGGKFKQLLGKGAKIASRGASRAQTGFTQLSIKSKPKLVSGADKMSSKQLFDASKGTPDRRTRGEYYSKIKWNEITDQEDRQIALSELGGMMNQKYLKSEYGETFKKMSNSGITSKEVMMGLSKDPVAMEKKINEKKEWINQRAENDGSGKIKEEIDANTTPENREEYLGNLAARTLAFQNMKDKAIGELSKEDKASLHARLGSVKRNPHILKSMNDSSTPETFEKWLNGPGGIGTMSPKELYKENKGMSRYVSVNEFGRTLETKARTDNPYKNRRKGGTDWERTEREFDKQINKDKAQKIPKTPDGIFLDTKQLEKKIEELEKAIEKRGGDEESKYLELLGKAGLTNKSDNEKDQFKNKYIKAESTRRLIKEKQEIIQEGIIGDEEKEQLERAKKPSKLKKPIGAIRHRKTERLIRRKKKIDERPIVPKIMVPPLRGVTDKIRTKAPLVGLNARIKRLQKKLDKKIIKKGSETQKLAEMILEEYGNINEKIKELGVVATNVVKKEKAIKKATEEATKAGITIDPVVMKSHTQRLGILQAKYKAQEIEIKKQKEKIESDLEDMKLKNLIK